MTRARNVGQEPGPSTGQARADADPNSVTTPVDVDTQLYLRLIGLLKISQMTAAEIVDVALRVTATAIESALLMHTEGRVTTEMIEKELGKQAKKKHTSMLGLSEDDETDEEMIARMRKAKRKGHVTYADDVDDEEKHLGAKLLTTLQSILTPPKEPAVAVPRALQAAQESVSGGEMALPLPVGVVHRMIGRFMQKYGLKKHVTSKGVPPDTYCRYCSAVVNLKEQEKGIFCCEDARRLKDICREWKQCVLSIRGSAGLTEAHGVTKKKSQLPDEIREAKTRELKGSKEDQSLKPGTSRAALGKDASSVKVKEQERMKLEKIKDETSELAPRRKCSKITAKAQQEKSETQKGLKRGDSEAASKTLRAGATDDKVLEKRGQKRDIWDTGKSEAHLDTAEDEMYKSKDARGKVAAGENQRSQTGQARDQKENKAFKPGISWAALGKDASSVNVKEQERMKLENIKVAGKEKRKADSDLEQMEPSVSKLQQSRQERAEHPSRKKENCAPRLQKKILSVHEEDFSNNEAAKETVRQKQSRPGKELLYTEEGKMLRDQSLSEEGRKRKPSSVGGRTSKRGSPGRDAFEDPAGSRSKSVRVSIHSDSSHKIETRKSRGQSENLKKSSQSQRKSSSQHPNGADDGQTLYDKVSIREGASRMSPRSVRGLKDKTESVFRGSRAAASIRESVSSGRGKGSLSMPKAYPSILYRLSEQEFIDSGWTILPSKTTPQKLVTYQATGAKIPCFWVCPKEDTTVEGNMEKMLYKNGNTFAIFYSNGNIKIFYPNGKQAIIIKRDKKGCLVTIMSPGGKNEKGTYMQPMTVGTFDSLGHGVIYNDYGDVRLAYNQEGGTYYETPHGHNIKWRWPISFAINFIKAHFSELCENKSRNAETLLHIRDLLAAKDKRDTKESRSSGARKEISPAKQPSPAKEISPAKQPSPAKEPSPVKEISPAKQSSPAKETSSGSPGGRESSNEIKRAGSFGSPKKSPYKEHIENSPEKKESTSTNIKESNRSKRRFQQEDTLSFSPLYMPPAIAACKMDEVEARAERKRQNLLNKAMNVAASCTPMSIIVLKINSFLGFRLLDQAAISIQFTAQDRFVRLELGVQIDPMAKPQVQMVEPSLLNSCVPAQLLCLQKKSH